MKTPRFLVPACALALALAACGSSDDGLHPDDAALLSQPDAAGPPAAVPATDTTTTPAPPAPQAGSAQPVALADNALAIGGSVNAEGAVTGAQPSYSGASTIHASVPTGGYSPGTEVTIYWFAPNGTSVKTETRPIPAGAKFVNFTLGPDAKLAAGAYTAQVDVGEMPVGMVDFLVQ